MCGRYTLTSPDDAVGHFRLPSVPNLGPRYNIAPSQESLIVRSVDGGERQGLLAAWGFGLRPDAGKARSRLIINARSEDVERRPLFREGFARRRCLVPANGFYEWRRIGKTRQPYYFALPDSSLFGFAGLWSPAPDDRATFVILTTRANGTVAPIHDRMPVILGAEHYSAWLGPGGLSDTAAREMRRPWPVDSLVSRPVGIRVNDPSCDDEACIRPLQGPVDLFAY